MADVARLSNQVVDLQNERDALMTQNAELVKALRDQLNDCINFDGGKLTDVIMEHSSKILKSTPAQCLRDIQADAVNTLQLDEYDAGFLNDFGGGNVGWWQDYMRSELGRAYDYYQVQIQQYAAKVREGGNKTINQTEGK